MTNIVATIIISVTTNWTEIGTFTPVNGTPEKVEVGNVVTNTIAVVEWKHQKYEWVLEITNGPKCGERRTAIAPTIQVFTNAYPKWIPGIVITNSVTPL